jgi:aminoglycoside phosphotransferase (APT) family kinase protein
MDDATLRDRLEEFLRGRLADAAGVRVTALERSTEGFSAETFTFDVDVARNGTVEQRAFVLKREPLAGLLEPYDLEPEFRVLHALSAHPLPSPPTPWLERDAAVLERSFYVMERLPGDVPIPVAGPDGCGPFTEIERASLGADVVDALAQLHTVDWRGLGLGFLGDPGPGRAAAARELGRWEDRIRRSELPLDPALAEALGWLRGHLPATSDITLVHGDYRLGNFLVARNAGAARLSGILDWELVHLGDPMEDVAWCTSELWRGGTALASGVMSPEEFVERWAAATGRAPGAQRLHFYRVLAVVKMIAIMLTGLRAFRDGRTADLRMAIFDHQLPYLYLLLGMLRGWMGGV